jgi:hypothetical protein
MHGYNAMLDILPLLPGLLEASFPEAPLKQLPLVLHSSWTPGSGDGLKGDDAEVDVAEVHGGAPLVDRLKAKAQQHWDQYAISEVRAYAIIT